jgi:hypothetical protein
MTIIIMQAQNTPAKRRIDLHSALMSDPYPTEIRETFTSTRRTEEIKATQRNRDYSRAHRCKLRLLVSR